MTLSKFFFKNIFLIIGGMALGLSVPFGATVINPMMDFVVFFPIGIIMLGISYFYTFVKKTD